MTASVQVARDDFEASLVPRNAAALRVVVALGVVLVPTFWALDWFVIPEYIWLAFYMRLSCTLYGVLILALARLRPQWVERHVGGLSFSFSLAIAWSIALMCFMHEGYESPYYGGINLVVMGVGLLFSWRTRTAVLFNAAIYVFYMAPLLLGLLPLRDSTVVLSNQFFLLATIIITVASQHHRRRLERREFDAQITQQHLLAEVQTMATTDWLTSLYNRRHFFRLGEEEIERARRFGSPISVVMIDIDHFKAINDTHGHSVGDEVLCAIAKRIASGLRRSDIAGRYGGEEFAVVLPETEANSATAIVGERLREAVGARPIDTAAGPLQVTISVGVAGVALARETLIEALTRADTGLYAAKRAGRNRVVRWSPELTGEEAAPRLPPPQQAPPVAFTVAEG